jgi:hypothetical protein
VFRPSRLSLRTEVPRAKKRISPSSLSPAEKILTMPHPQFKVFHVWGCVLSPGKSAGLRISAKARTPYRRPPQYGGDSRGTNVAGHQFLLRKRDALYAPRKITTLNPFRAVCGKRA